MYHEGNRSLQERFDSRRIADRLVEVLHRVRFSDEDRAFIESRAMFFLATADRNGARSSAARACVEADGRVQGLPAEAAIAAPMMPASLPKRARTISARLVSSGAKYCQFSVTPPPMMKRSGQSSA